MVVCASHGGLRYHTILPHVWWIRPRLRWPEKVDQDEPMERSRLACAPTSPSVLRLSESPVAYVDGAVFRSRRNPR